MLKNLICKSGYLSKASLGLLYNVPKRDFAIRSAQATILTGKQEQSPFNRETLKQFYEQVPLEVLRDIEVKERERQDLEDKFNNKFNEKNPLNCVAVKIRAPQEPDIASNLSHPFILHVQPRKPKVVITGRRRKLRTSLSKLAQFQKSCSGLHLLDAIAFLESSDKKAAEYIKNTIIQTRRHAIDKGFEPEKLWVKEVVGGKQSRIKRIRYHAKGKHGIMIRDTCQLLVKLEARSSEELFRSFFEGKDIPRIALDLIRKDMVGANINLPTLQQEMFLLTAKGRQQKKLMLKRKAILIHQTLKVMFLLTLCKPYL